MNESEFIRRLRLTIDADPGLTPAGLAISAGLNNSVIRAMLAGRIKNPRLDTMQKICAALGTTLDQFMAPDQTAEEAEIVRLTGLLPDHLHHQLLGYAKALAAQPGPAPPESSEGNQ